MFTLSQYLAPPPSVPEEQPVEEQPFELPTLEEVARATGTLRSQPLGTPACRTTTSDCKCLVAVSDVYCGCVCSVSSPGITEQQQSQEKEVDSNLKDEILLNVIRPDYERPAPPPPMEPLYHVKEDGKVQGKHTLI